MTVWPFYHRGGCNQVAFYYTRKPQNGELIFQSHDVILLDGNPPNLGDLVRCGECGESIITETHGTLFIDEWLGDPIEVEFPQGVA